MSTKKKEAWLLLIGLGEWLVILGSLAAQIWLLGLNQSIMTLVPCIVLLLAVGAYGTYAIIAERKA